MDVKVCPRCGASGTDQFCASCGWNVGVPFEGVTRATGPNDTRVSDARRQAEPGPWPTVFFSAAAVAALVGMGILISGVVGGTGEVIRLAPIYLGMGTIMLAVVIALFAIGTQLALSWRGSSEPWRGSSEPIGSIGASAPPASKGVPDVTGKNLQLALDTLRRAGCGDFLYRDASGHKATPTSPSNWVVIAQDPTPGTQRATDRLITLTIKNMGE